MAVLVGNYLLDCEAHAGGRDDRDSWAGVWTLFRSPNASLCLWEPLTTGRTPMSFASAQDALDAALEAGAEVARTLQSDPCLEPMQWQGTVEAHAVLPRRAACH